MKVIAIAAVGKNGVIGNDLDLPWEIPEDMKFFRDSTRSFYPAAHERRAGSWETVD